MPDKYGITTKDIIYSCPDKITPPGNKPPIDIIGFDTEADREGRCFMIATSEGDYFDYRDFPHCLFSRKYRNKKFVTYNLSYDETALLQFLPEGELRELWESGTVEYDGYKVRSIPKKMLRITRKNNGISFYDMLNFYGGSLNYNAKRYLNTQKIDVDPLYFNPLFIRKYWNLIGKYCVYDSVIVRELGKYIINMFVELGINPNKLYSTAYVSWQWFHRQCGVITVKDIWEHDREVLDFAMQSYNGGKFEVTAKGTGEMWEYDIVSAYPAQIRELKDISAARIVKDKKYRKAADYGFLKCRMNIPPQLPSPVAIRYGQVNTYPVGQIGKVITKAEYEYLIAQGADIDIIEAYWLYCGTDRRPFKDAIDHLVQEKQKSKEAGNDLRYHTTKILMNSFYGKFVQLIPQGKYYRAGMNWNPIYGSVITSNVRILISSLQLRFPEIIAVHTDSVIATQKLPFPTVGELGSLIYEVSGYGTLLGCGIYQIADKVRWRGFPLRKVSAEAAAEMQAAAGQDSVVIREGLHELFAYDTPTVKIFQQRPFSWREVAFHRWPSSLLNRFQDASKEVHVQFDKKRIWIDDYTSFSDIPTRNIVSFPHFGLNLRLDRFGDFVYEII